MAAKKNKKKKKKDITVKESHIFYKTGFLNPVCDSSIISHLPIRTKLFNLNNSADEFKCHVSYRALPGNLYKDTGYLLVSLVLVDI